MIESSKGPTATDPDFFHTIIGFRSLTSVIPPPSPPFGVNGI